jgi:hypothetical protein
VKNLLEELYYIGGWSILSTANVDPIKIFERISSLLKLNVKSMFDLYVGQDPKNPQKRILRVTIQELICFFTQKFN